MHQERDEGMERDECGFWVIRMKERGRLHATTSLIILSGISHVLRPTKLRRHGSCYHTELWSIAALGNQRGMKYVWGCRRGWNVIGGAPKRTGATVGIASKMNAIDLLALGCTYRGCSELLSWLCLGHSVPSAPASLYLALQRGKELRHEED